MDNMDQAAQLRNVTKLLNMIEGVWWCFSEEKSNHRKSDANWLLSLRQPVLSCNFSALEWNKSSENECW